MTENRRKMLHKFLWGIIVTLILALILGVVLFSFMRKKNVPVEVKIIANQMSFQGMGPRLIEFASTEAIMLTNFRDIRFSAQRILYDETVIPVEGEVLVQPLEDAKSPRVIFTRAGMSFEQFDIGIGSIVTFKHSEDEANVQIAVRRMPGEKPVDPSTGRIGLGASLGGEPEPCFELQMSRCNLVKLVDGKEQILISTDHDNPQKTCKITLSDEKPVFTSDPDRVFRVVLEKLVQNDPFFFGSAPIRWINFNYSKRPGRKISTVKSGEVAFKENILSDIQLKLGDFVYLSASDTLEIVRLQLSPTGLEIMLAGRIDSLKLGQAAGALSEKLPLMIEWLVSKQIWMSIFGFLGWAIGLIVAIVLAKKTGNSGQQQEVGD